MDLCAAYHIKKLSWHLLIMLTIGVPVSLVSSGANPLPDSIDEEKLFSENQINGKRNFR